MFNTWVVGCNGEMGVEQVRDDLLSACKVIQTKSLSQGLKQAIIAINRFLKIFKRKFERTLYAEEEEYEYYSTSTAEYGGPHTWKHVCSTIIADSIHLRPGLLGHLVRLPNRF